MMIGHPPDSSAASIHTYNNTRRTSNALPKNIMQQNRERDSKGGGGTF